MAQGPKRISPWAAFRRGRLEMSPLRLGLSATLRDLIAVLLILVVCVVLLGLVHGASIVQFLVNGIVVGSIYVLGATGLTLIFGIRKFANFAHGDMMTFGAYIAFLVNGMLFLDILWGFLVAIILTSILGVLMEVLVFRKLATRGPVSALVASIGVTIFLQNFLNATFGTSINTYNITLSQNIVLLVWDGVPVLSINPLRGIATLVIGVAIIVLLHVLLKYTTIGKAMRATADNQDLARASGIRVRAVIMFTWALSGALAGVAGVLLGIFIDVRPGVGFSVLLFVFAAVIVGGLGSPYGAMLGGFIVGIAQEMSAAFLILLGNDANVSFLVEGLRSPAMITLLLGITSTLASVAFVFASQLGERLGYLIALAYLVAWALVLEARAIPTAFAGIGIAGTFLLLVVLRQKLQMLGLPYLLLFVGLLLWIPTMFAAFAPPRVGGLEQPIAYRPIIAFAIMILVLLLRPGGLAAGKIATIRGSVAAGRRVLMPGGNRS